MYGFCIAFALHSFVFDTQSRRGGVACFVVCCGLLMSLSWCDTGFTSRSCHVMSCHVMSCHVMSCHVMVWGSVVWLFHVFLCGCSCRFAPSPSLTFASFFCSDSYQSVGLLRISLVVGKQELCPLSRRLCGTPQHLHGVRVYGSGLLVPHPHSVIH